METQKVDTTYATHRQIWEKIEMKHLKSTKLVSFQTNSLKRLLVWLIKWLLILFELPSDWASGFRSNVTFHK